MSCLRAALVLGLLVALGAGSRVLAHGEETLELGAERVQPGGTVEVRGDLGTGERFEVALISQVDGSRWVVGTIDALEEGHVDGYVTVPPETPAGDYFVEVTAEGVVDAATMRARIAIAGSPIGSDGERPDQADGLPGPATSSFPGGGPAAVGVLPSRSGPVDAPAEPEVAPNRLAIATVAAGVVGVLALVVIGGAILLRARTDRG